MGKMSGESRMSIYTKNGDKGTTNLVHTKNVSKADDRIQLEGTSVKKHHIRIFHLRFFKGKAWTVKQLLRLYSSLQESLGSFLYLYPVYIWNKATPLVLVLKQKLIPVCIHPVFHQMGNLHFHLFLQTFFRRKKKIGRYPDRLIEYRICLIQRIIRQIKYAAKLWFPKL